MASFKSIALSALCLASASMAVAQEVSYIPQVHGTVRSRWELDTRSGDSRFRVRNARLSVGGYIAPPLTISSRPNLTAMTICFCLMPMAVSVSSRA